MKLLIPLLFIAGTVFAECDYDCDCVDLRTLFIGPVDISITHTKGPKCYNNFTVSGKTPYAVGNLINSEHIYPEKPEKFKIVVKVAWQTTDILPTEFFSPLGLTCEDGKWMITKFPVGIFDEGGQCKFLECLPVSEVNGKGYKAELLQLTNAY
ncbi:unnamed protein product [Caenorhabditis brenneri]